MIANGKITKFEDIEMAMKMEDEIDNMPAAELEMFEQGEAW